MTRRQLASDVLVGSLLIGVTYATPARLRPALGLALAVTLSRQHGAAHRRDLVRLFDERQSVKHHLQYTVDPELDELAHRLDDLEDALAAASLSYAVEGGAQAVERIGARIRERRA